MNRLNPLTLPLNQNALIEASAGTGKTFTITTLYLRALLGLTSGKIELSPLSIDQILVVTFTEAATQEIRDRVRSKLIEAQNALMAMAAERDVKDQLLLSVLQQYIDAKLAESEHKDRQAAILAGYHRLQDAITLIDEASIYTIHGFCNKCLKQFAFETNSAFEQEFQLDSQPLVLEALLDFWRKEIGGLTDAKFEWFQFYWKSPQDLLKELNSIVGKDITISPVVNQSEYLDNVARYQSLILKFKCLWKVTDVNASLLASDLKKNLAVYKKVPLLNEFAHSSNWIPDFGKKDGWKLWSSESLANSKNYKAKGKVLNLEISKLIDELDQCEESLAKGQFKSFWLAKAKAYVETRGQAIKNERLIINPDDLLTELLAAINSPQGELLKQSLSHKYPLAFIDEFQDTDSIQYQIFSALYDETSENFPAMILIGDPKQAIYKFRGADIFTYIAAKENLPEPQHYTLDTNWRSAPSLIQAINHVFTSSKAGFLHKQIPFHPVLSGKSGKNSLKVDGVVPAALSFFHLVPDDKGGEKSAPGFNAGQSESLFASWCATDINNLLRADTSLSDSKRQVEAGDICVLVRNRHQASIMQSALRKLNIQSVYISRENVLNNPLAKDLFRLMQAIHQPQNEQLIKNAIAGLYFSHSVTDLKQLLADQFSWQECLMAFHQANHLWKIGRLANAIETVLAYAKTLFKWRNEQQDKFERLVTDHRHLIELVQKKASEVSGHEKLLTWLEQSLSDPSAATEEQQLRLESDKNLVQIVTMHASKGLEYPVVYIPFAMDSKPEKTALYTSQSENKGLTYRVDNRLLELQIAEQERLAEDIRLLYVAMTRAKYKLVLGVCNLLDRYKRTLIGQSAFGLTLLGELESNEGINEFIEQKCLSYTQSMPDAVDYFKATDIEVLRANQKVDLMIPEGEKTPAINVEPFAGKIPNDWRLVSYSGLVAGAHSANYQETSEDTIEADHDQQLVHEPKVELEAVSINFNDRFEFPRGAEAGSCLHWILENLIFQSQVSAQKDVIEKGLELYGIELNWTEMVVEWMQEILDADLGQWCLGQLEERDKLVEMEFYFNFEHLSPRVLANALKMIGIEHASFNPNMLAQGESNFAGILKGFIDLTVSFDGRFYVLDYKSNHLGNNFDDYQLANMKQSMSDHNYYLQALIYTVALHRFLKQNLPKYQYEQHVGGAIYLFLRGMGNESEVATKESSKAFDSKGVFPILFDEEVILYLDNALLNCNAIPSISNKDAQQQIGFDF